MKLELFPAHVEMILAETLPFVISVLALFVNFMALLSQITFVFTEVVVVLILNMALIFMALIVMVIIGMMLIVLLFVVEMVILVVMLRYDRMMALSIMMWCLC